MSRTIRSSRTKTAMLVSAGTVAALLSVVPSTAAVADTLPSGQSVAMPGSGALVMSFDDDRRGERGERGERGPQGEQGPPGPAGPEGELDTYVVTGLVATDAVGLDVTSTALCLGNDVAIGGGYDSNDPVAIDVEDSAPVFVGTGPATGWRATAAVVAAGGSITAFAVCHDVE